MHPTHLLPVRGRRAPSRRQGTREGIHSETRWRAFYAERKCEFRVLFSARAAQNEFFYSTLFWTPFSGERPPYHLEGASGKPLELQCAIAVHLGHFAAKAQATVFTQLARAIYKTPQTGVTLQTLVEATRVLLCHGGDFLNAWVLEPVPLPAQDHKNSIRVRPSTDPPGRWSVVASITRKWARFGSWQLKALGKRLLESGCVVEGEAFCTLLNSATEQAGVPGAAGGMVSPVTRRKDNDTDHGPNGRVAMVVGATGLRSALHLDSRSTSGVAATRRRRCPLFGGKWEHE